MSESAPVSSSFDDTLAALQAKFPDAEVESLTYSGGRMIVRTPDEVAYARWLADSAEKGKLSAAAGALCRRSILWPSTDVIDALFRRKPALSLRIVDKLLEKAGGGDEIALGK